MHLSFKFACLLALAASQAYSQNIPLNLMQPLGGFSVGIHSGRALEDLKPVGMLQIVRRDRRAAERYQFFCSTTLIDDDVAITAGHCLDPFHQSDGSLRLGEGEELHAVFDPTFSRAPSRTYQVIGIYHQIPAPNSPAYLRWQAFQNGTRDVETMDRINTIDVTLLKLKESPSRIQRIRPATVARLSDRRVEGRSLVGFGTYQYSPADEVPVTSRVGTRHQGDLETLNDLSSAMVQAETVLPEGARLSGADRGDSGGFLGRVDGERFQLEGVISAIAVNRPPFLLAGGTKIPVRIRSIDETLERWIADGKDYFQREDHSFSISRPSVDIGKVALNRLTEITVPRWAAGVTQTVSEQLRAFEANAQPVLIRRYQGRTPIPFAGLALHHAGKWNGENFVLVFHATFSSERERDRVAEAIETNVKRRGLPRCWAEEAVNWGAALTSPALLGFSSPRPVQVKLTDEVFAIVQEGSGCERERELY